MKLWPEHQPGKQPLTPKEAAVMSLGVVIGGIPAVAAAHLIFFVPLGTALLWYGLVSYLTLAHSWSSLDWASKRTAGRTRGCFVIFVFCLFVVVAVVQKANEPFPDWAIASLILGGVAAYSVAGIWGVRNFLRWRRASFLEGFEITHSS
ncbi:MAG: hypothetical protein HY360_26235 [Verrucomicrobia bacterium]|nr:hypothetical protein [Verrucomicrobiota bacterium]